MFALIGRLLYNIMMVFAVHQHESATGIQESPHSEPLSYLPPLPIPLSLFVCVSDILCFNIFEL